jgi:hypothetical protein
MATACAARAEEPPPAPVCEALNIKSLKDDAAKKQAFLRESAARGHRNFKLDGSVVCAW